jgi:hypothetical protein
MNCSMEECVGSVLVIALGTAIATDAISLPPQMMASPITTVILVLMAVGAFVKFPVLGVAIFLTIAVILFKRNMLTTRAYATYAADAIRQQPRVDAEPGATNMSTPRQYDQFQETDARNPMHAPVHEGFEPAPYGDADLNENVEGAFPVGAARASSTPESLDYAYRPDQDTGSNAFERFGPQMDEKARAFAY